MFSASTNLRPVNTSYSEIIRHKTIDLGHFSSRINKLIAFKNRKSHKFYWLKDRIPKFFQRYMFVIKYKIYREEFI
jgi:hypothetical protein